MEFQKQPLALLAVGDASEPDVEIAIDAKTFASRRSSDRAWRLYVGGFMAMVAGAVVVALRVGLFHLATPEASLEGHSSVELVAMEDPCLHEGDAPCTPPRALPVVDRRQCSARGENCISTQCCAQEGMQCFEQDEGYGECRAECAPGPDPIFGNGKPWSCRALGDRAAGHAPVCSKPGEDCGASQCCADAGMQCYEKVPGYWATCRVACTKGLDLFDAVQGLWTCRELGPRAPEAAPWVKDQCSPAGADCRATQCCAAPGHQCYALDEFWAQCQPACTPGPDALQPGKSWSCTTLGSRTPAAAPPPPGPGAPLAAWVGATCARSGENCTASMCCSEPGMQCVEKAGGLAQCKATCTPGPDLYDVDSTPWTCRVLGPRTPGAAKVPSARNVSAWARTNCSADGEGCLSSQCCREVGAQCYTKSDGWAACLGDCAPGKGRASLGDIDDAPWTCTPLGMRTPRPWNTPSLFCFNVIRTVGYEADLVRNQMYKSVGIFSCEEYAVFSNTPYSGHATTWWTPPDEQEADVPLVPMHLGVGPDGSVDTIPFKPTYVGTSMDNTAGNADLFLRVWDKVKEGGKYLNTDFTIKVDPDAVMLAPRVRSILMQYTGMSTYIVNCDKPGMTPMMFGSVEMYTKQAMVTFFDGQSRCLSSLSWKAWGEDYFMGKCLDFLGVSRTDQFTMVSDGVCKGVNCRDPMAAVFHPKKDSGAWMACLSEAEAAR